jgi:hypothetical protein
LSPSGRAKLEENKKDVGKINGFTCGIAKGQMKNALDRELSDESQYPDAIATACWMSKNSVRYTKNLNICNQSSSQQQNNQQQNNQQQNNQQQNNQKQNNQQQTNSSYNGETFNISIDDVIEIPDDNSLATGMNNQNTNLTSSSGQSNDVRSYELDSVDKIKDFQNWMDDNYGKWAWSTRYNKSYKVNENPRLGWGAMGPNTTKKWADSTIKKKYLDFMGIK